MMLTTHHYMSPFPRETHLLDHPITSVYGTLLMIFPLVLLFFKGSKSDDELSQADETKMLREENLELLRYIDKLQKREQSVAFKFSALTLERDDLLTSNEVLQNEWGKINAQLKNLRKQYTETLKKQRESVLLRDEDHFTLDNLWHNLLIEKKRTEEWQTRVQSLQTQGCFQWTYLTKAGATEKL